MSAKHTPGPWHALHTRVDDASGYQVCHGDLHGKGEAENVANLCLIAAAPELLETLAEFVRIDDEDVTGLMCDYASDLVIVLGKARAALAKARGES